MIERLRLINILRKNRLGFPIILFDEAKKAGVPLAVAAAVLQQETGGRNVFGHDPTIFVGAGTVTKKKYLAYKAKRGPKGKGGMQGVGPMQLTWYAFQDEADKEGGSWQPRVNIRVGLRILSRLIKKYGTSDAGLRQVFRAYNGSYTYADQVLNRTHRWRKLLAAKPAKKALIEPRQGFKSLDPLLHRAYSEGRRRGFTDLGTYAKKHGDHGKWPAMAFDLGDEHRFFMKGWAYLKARSLANYYVAHHEELNIEYVILGMRIWSRNHGWHEYKRDRSHMFHIHVSGHRG